MTYNPKSSAVVNPRSAEIILEKSFGGRGHCVTFKKNKFLHRVKAGFFDRAKTIAPQFFRAAKIVKSAAVNKYVLAVNRQAMAVIADAVGMGGFARGQFSGGGETPAIITEAAAATVKRTRMAGGFS